MGEGGEQVCVTESERVRKWEGSGRRGVRRGDGGGSMMRIERRRSGDVRSVMW